MNWRELRGGTAGDVLRHYGIATPPVDIQQIVLGSGIEIHYEMNLANPCLITMKPHAPPSIQLQAEAHPYIHRFALAHALGHLITMDFGEGIIQEPYSTWTLTETNFIHESTKANNFAAELLVPLWMLNAAYLPFKKNRKKLSGIFGVTEAAMQVRLNEMMGIK